MTIMRYRIDISHLRTIVNSSGIRQLSINKSARHENAYSTTSSAIEEETCPSYHPQQFYSARVGQVLADKYTLVSKLGWGTGSTVWLAGSKSRWPWQKHPYVALKITNSSPATQAAARRELDLSNHMFSISSRHPGRNYVRRVLDSFEIDAIGGSHLCMAFEPLRQPMWMLGSQFSRDGRVPPRIIKALLPSILKCIDFLHSECNVIHTDLKNDHFMIPFEDPSVLDDYVSNMQSNPPKCIERDGRIICQSHSNFGRLQKGVGYAKVTDFGLGARGHVSMLHKHDIQPQEYTAPEVILKTGWSYPADIWNLGLVMWELLAHASILNGRSLAHPDFSEKVRLGQIIRLIGPPPNEILSKADKGARSRFFNDDASFKYPEVVPGASFNFETLSSMFEGEEKELFIAFMRRMVTWLPKDRATAKELLADPWLNSSGRGKKNWMSRFRFGEEAESASMF